MKKKFPDKLFGLLNLDKSLQVIVAVFCLFLFPLFILYSSLTRLYEIKVEALRSATVSNLTQRLESLDKYSSNRQYFHHLFKKIFALAQKSKNPKNYLAKNIGNLKAQYPGMLEFIVWDSQGRIIDELTDQQGYKFILKRMYTTLAAVAKALKADLAVDIAELPAVKRNENLVGKFIGRFFIAKFLKKPYLSGKDAGPSRVDFAAERSDYWYQIGSQLSFFVFFNNFILEKRVDGLEQLVRSVNTNQVDQYSGFVSGSALEQIGDDVPQQFKADLLLALAKFEKHGSPVAESKNSLIVLKTTGKNLRLFAVAVKDADKWNVAARRNGTLMRVLTILFILYSLIYFCLYKLQVFVSIRTRLILVFLFANLIPLLLLGFISYDYLQSRRSLLVNKFINQSFENLLGLDQQAQRPIKAIEEKLGKSCLNINLVAKGQELNATHISMLKKAVAEADPEEAYLVASSGLKLLEYFSDDIKPSYSNSYILPMMLSSLNFLNGEIRQAQKSDYFNALLSPENSESVRLINRNLSKMIEINAGNKLKQAFQYAFGDYARGNFNYFLLLLWNQKEISRRYANEFLPSLVGNQPEVNTFVRSADGTFSWPNRDKFSRPLLEFFEKVAVGRKNISEIVFLNGQPNILVGIKGRQMNDMILASHIPLAAVTASLQPLKAYMVLAVVLNIVLTLVISLFLSRQIMQPLNDLQHATLALGKRNFRYRIAAYDADELGYLSMTFNRVLEGLGELEVARIVQESLFPGNNFAAGSYEIYGRSIVMTTLGGDYYDCFPVDENHQALVIGDVAGHGVAAGLMMAMAKAGVVTASQEQRLDPVQIIQLLHQVFSTARSQKMRRMMTFQYFVLNHQSHEFVYTNAGHCFPIIVDPESGSAKFLEYVSPPLGVGIKPRHKNQTFSLQPGQAMLLYTDGIAEARNARQEEFGFNRLLTIVPELYDPDPEVFYNNLYTVYKQWAVEAEDDLTMIVIVRGLE